MDSPRLVNSWTGTPGSGIIQLRGSRSSALAELNRRIDAGVPEEVALEQLSGRSDKRSMVPIPEH